MYSNVWFFILRIKNSAPISFSLALISNLLCPRVYLLHGIRANSLLMASIQENHSFSTSPPIRSTSNVSFMSQFDFTAVSKAFSFILLKLDSKNYIFWKAQILATIRAFDLVSFLNKASLPSKYITDSTSDNSTVCSEVNPEYVSWLRSD